MNFDFNQDYILEDEIALLRPLELSDEEHLLPFALHEADLFIYTWEKAIGADGLRTYLQNAMQARQDKKEYAFIVWDKRTKCYAGTTRFYDFQPERKFVQIGYTWYGKAFQGSGLNKCCKFLLFRFAFEHMGAEQVELSADVNNHRSIAAMKSVGCEPYGYVSDETICPGQSCRDRLHFRLLKSDWEKDIKANLALKIKSFMA